MSTRAQIQIHFPVPGDWERFRLTALWLDGTGYACRQSYGPAELPSSHQPALRGVVARLVALDEPWQASHVAVEPCFPELSEGVESSGPVALALLISARRADGARRRFTPQDYPELLLTDAEVLTAFNALTNH